MAQYILEKIPPVANPVTATNGDPRLTVVVTTDSVTASKCIKSPRLTSKTMLKQCLFQCRIFWTKM